MRICNTCSSKIDKSSHIYKAKYDKFIEKHLPKTDKPYHYVNTIKIKVTGIQANSTIFYFAALPRDFTKNILTRDNAYNKLQNSGVTKSNSNGVAYFYLKCPQVYQVPEKKIFSRHFHFLYWKDNQWGKKVYSHKIVCEVDKKFVKRHLKNNNVVIIDTLPKESFNNNHIDGAINVQYDQYINKNKLLKDIQIRTGKDKVSLSVPIIIYCLDKYCDVALIVKERLDRIGFCNTMYYHDGLKDWCK